MHRTLALLLLGSIPVAAAAARLPNIVVIVADDLGYADLGIHGSKDIPTPHIDALFNSGVRCTSGYVSGTYCSPTRAGMLTGRYQQRFGHEFNPGPNTGRSADFGLSLQETTLPQRLKAAGYRTGMVGKWHLGHAAKYRPQQRGFDDFYGFLGGAHSYLRPAAANNDVMRNNDPVDEKEYLTDAFAREAVAFIDRNAAAPFFLYLTFNAVHTPMEATEKYLSRFAAIADPKRRTYAAMLSAMDDAVGRVTDKLRAAGLDDHTLVFFVSDNGGPPANASSNAPLSGRKATVWEGGIRVPFAVRWTGQIPAGRTYDHPVIQLDFLPTALAAAGVAVRPEWKLDGVNLLPHLRGEKTSPPHDALYWRFGPQLAIRQGDWKLMKTPQGTPNQPATTANAVLINLKEDIGEKTDLAAKHPEKVRELAALWNKWNDELIKPTWPAPRAKAKAKAKAKGQ